MKDKATKKVVLRGIRPIMFDRYAGDNNTELTVEQRMYYAPDGETIVLPSQNILAALASNLYKCATKIKYGKQHGEKTDAIQGFVDIDPVKIPFLRDGKPIKFIGVGEKLNQMELFHPDRMASRILGMGDVVSLVEKAQATIDAEEAQKLEEKFRKATFSLEDFGKQIRQMRRIGPFKDLLAMIPGWGSRFDQMDIVALGSGTTPHEVSGLVKQFRQMRTVMKEMADGSLAKAGVGLKDMPGLMARGPVKTKRRSKRLKGKRKRKKRR